MAQPFTWVGNQKVSTPEAAARQRAIAEALIGQASSPASNWAEGLSDVAAAFTGTQLNNRTMEAEEAGRISAAEALAGITPESDFSSIASALSNPWLSGPQAQIGSALLQQNMQRSDPAYGLDMAYKQAQIDKMNAESAGGGTEYFGSTIPWQDASGNLQYYQLRKGEGLPMLPEGARWLEPTTTVNTGTQHTILGRNTGQVQGGIGIDSYQPAYDSAAGSAEAKSDVDKQSLANSIESKMPGLEAVVSELGELAKTATYTKAGQLVDTFMRETGQQVPESAVARQQYISMVDNQILPLLRDTFGAQFTQKEGETLKATLGNPDLSPIEKQAVLNAFISQKRRDLEALKGTATSNPASGVEVIDWTDL